MLSLELEQKFKLIIFNQAQPSVDIVRVHLSIISQSIWTGAHTVLPFLHIQLYSTSMLSDLRKLSDLIEDETKHNQKTEYCISSASDRTRRLQTRCYAQRRVQCSALLRQTASRAGSRRVARRSPECIDCSITICSSPLESPLSSPAPTGNRLLICVRPAGRPASRNTSGDSIIRKHSARDATRREQESECERNGMERDGTLCAI